MAYFLWKNRSLGPVPVLGASLSPFTLGAPICETDEGTTAQTGLRSSPEYTAWEPKSTDHRVCSHNANVLPPMRNKPGKDRLLGRPGLQPRTGKVTSTHERRSHCDTIPTLQVTREEVLSHRTSEKTSPILMLPLVTQPLLGRLWEALPGMLRLLIPNVLLRP